MAESQPDFAEIQWSPILTPYSMVRAGIDTYFNQRGFYLFLTGKYDPSDRKYHDVKLQYIGKAYSQTIRERVPQGHDAFVKINKYLKDNPGYEVLVKPGVIKETSQEKMTSEFFDDIEAYLIFTNKPPANTLNIEGYSGRDIIIKNLGDYAPLEELSYSS